MILDAVCLTSDISDCKLVTEPLRLLIVVVLLVTFDSMLFAFCSNLEIDVDCEDSCPVMLLMFVVFEVTFDSMLFAFCVSVATLLVIVVIDFSTSVFFSVHCVTFAPSSIFGFVIYTVHDVTPLWSLLFGN